MESNLTGTLNAGLCLVTVLALFLYRRNGARYKPGTASRECGAFPAVHQNQPERLRHRSLCGPVGCLYADARIHRNHFQHQCDYATSVRY